MQTPHTGLPNQASSPAMVLVRSISRQQPRVDDVLKTNRRWEHYGDVLEIPINEAGHYLAHPSEWERITPERHQEWLKEQENAQKAMSTAAAQWDALGLSELERMRADLDAEIKRRKSIPAKPVDAEIKMHTDAEPVQLSNTDPDTVAAATARMDKLMQVISEMPQTDVELWAHHPRVMPRVAPVSERMGEKVTQEEILQALQLMAARSVPQQS